MQNQEKPIDDLKPYKIFGCSILQVMSVVAIIGLALTVIYNCLA